MNVSQIKMKFIKADYIIAIAFLLMLMTHGITHYLLAVETSYSQTKEEAKQVAEYVEQNPIFSLVVASKKLSLIYSLVLAPSFFIAIYYYYRNKYFHNQIIIETVAVMVLAMFLINFGNDIPYLLAVLLN